MRRIALALLLLRSICVLSQVIPEKTEAKSPRHHRLR